MFFVDNDVSVDLIGIFKIDRAKYRNEAPTERSYDSISIRVEGSAVFRSSGREQAVKPGDVLYIPRCATYAQGSERETVIAIHFINLGNSGDTSLEKITPNHAEIVRELVLGMYSVWEEKKPGYKLECKSLFYHLLYVIRRQPEDTAEAARPTERLSPAVEYIHKNYTHGSISVSELSKKAALSEPYFRKLFHRTYSVSPKRYVINLRLEYASELLQSQLYSVAEVSEKTGFNDVKYFTRLFKERYLISPSLYKNTAQPPHKAAAENAAAAERDRDEAVGHSGGKGRG